MGYLLRKLVSYGFVNNGADVLNKEDCFSGEDIRGDGERARSWSENS